MSTAGAHAKESHGWTAWDEWWASHAPENSEAAVAAMDGVAFDQVAPHMFAMGMLIALSAFFAGSETAFFSLSRATRERLARSAHAIDRYVAALVAEPRRMISTLLLGNEFINISFAALSTIVTAHVLRGADALTITLVATAITVPLLLLLGEILPKTIALAVAEGWAKLAARPLGWFMWLTTPLRWVVSGIAVGILRVFRLRIDRTPTELGPEEFKAMVDAGSEGGQLEDAERSLIHKVFELSHRKVTTAMTPATKLFSLSFDLPVARLATEAAKSGFSRVPIHRGKQREIVGILMAKDLVGWTTGRLAHLGLPDLLRPVYFVPTSVTCAEVFQEFRRRHTHIAMVVDEYGEVAGVVTMEDLLADLFGKFAERRASSTTPEELS